MRNHVLALFIFCLFPLGIIRSDTAPEKAEFASLEKRIHDLKDKLNEHHRIEMDEDVKSQGKMIGNWKAYGKDVEQIHKEEEQIREIEHEIKQLEERKTELLKQIKKLD